MENKIKELIKKYNVKTTEEPLHYFQWLEIINDLQSLLKMKGEAWENDYLTHLEVK